jgi:hypothetical protein
MEVSGQFHSSTALPPSGTHWIGPGLLYTGKYVVGPSHCLYIPPSLVSGELKEKNFRKRKGNFYVYFSR